MWKNLLAVGAGLVAAFFIDGLFTEFTAGAVGAESSDDPDFGQYLSDAEATASGMLIVGWALASMTAAFIARMILDKYTPDGIPLIPTLGVIVGILAVGIPASYPMWIIAGGIILSLPMGVFGNRFAKRFKK